MKRSAGITITAVIDFVGSAFTLFTALMSIFVLAAQSIIPPSRPGAPPIEIPPMLHYIQMAAVLIFVLAAVWGIATGVGLLKLREWARILAICYLAFLTLNALTTALAPGAQARYQEFQVEIQNIIRASTAYGAAPTPVHVPVWFGVAFSLPLMAVVLWLLAKSKPAFAPLTQKSASQ